MLSKEEVLSLIASQTGIALKDPLCEAEAAKLRALVEEGKALEAMQKLIETVAAHGWSIGHTYG